MAKREPAANDHKGRFAYDGLERVMHEKARLGILVALLKHPEGLLFAAIRDLVALTDGNLNRHLKALHEADLIEIWKGAGRQSQTLCRFRPEGRDRFRQYLSVLEAVVADAARVSAASSPSRGKQARK